MLRFRAARRPGLPARGILGDPFGLRNRLVRTDRHHHAVHAAAVPVRADGRAIPRVFFAGWVYRIPRWWKINGWEIGGLVRVQSGDAVPVTQATNTLSAFGYAVQRPNRIANPNAFANRSSGEWFDKSAFMAAGQFSIGNSSRNPVRGPGLQDADLMIGKTFRISERVNLEFRAEVFNVSNTPPLNDPSGSFGSAAFGTIKSAGNPRDFEFAAKIRF